MATSLEIKLRNILNEKTNKILPENIKENVTIFDVTGTYKGESEGSTETSGIKQFSTIEEMQADTTAEEGDLAIVYKDVMASPNPGEALNTVTFPDKVVFTSPISTTVSMEMSASVNGYSTTIYFTLTSTRFTINDMFEDMDTRRYDSTDGLTYTRTDTYEDTFDFGGNTVPTDADTNILKFLTISSQAFEGLYKHNGTEYVLAKTQFTTVPEDVMDTMFYGVNGVETGTLQETTDLSLEALQKRVAIWEKYNNLVTSATSLANAFKNATLETIPYIDTTTATSMSAMFKDCVNLKEIPLLNTTNVTSMYAMFDGCTNLTTIPLLDSSNVTNMESMFSSCVNLTEIPNLNTSSLNRASNMFYNCSKLTTIPNLDTSKTTGMTSMFQNCTNLVNVPVFNWGSATHLYRIFEGCTNLSNESLNNILASCISATTYSTNKNLKYMGLTSEQASRCTGLSNYAAFTSAGWTTGY